MSRQHIDTRIDHRWHLQVQSGNQDWSTVVDGARPIGTETFERYQRMTDTGAIFRVIHVVTTTQVERTVVEPVGPPRKDLVDLAHDQHQREIRDHRV